MTPEEAIEILKDFEKQVAAKAGGAYQSTIGNMACKFAIDNIKEVQQYREIGTLEECREAAEKQKPKKPDYEGDGYADGHMVYDTWICPNCGEKYEVDYDDYKHCPNCGQAILKENEDD